MASEQPGPDDADRRRPASHPRRRSAAVFVVAALLGALVWGAWLGRDHEASYDVVTGTTQYPYVTLQVLGCALTVGVVVALLAAWRHPLVGAGGVGAGFLVAWTVEAGTSDDSGLYLVGALLLAVGLALGTAVAAGVGAGAAALVRAARRRRGPRPA